MSCYCLSCLALFGNPEEESDSSYLPFRLTSPSGFGFGPLNLQARKGLMG
jgi:hypothetical protein